MGDEPDYNLGRQGAPAPRWEDLDAETRAKLTQALATTVQDLRIAIQPVIDSVRETVLPVLESFSDWLPSLVPAYDMFGEITAFLREWVPNWPSDLDTEKAWDITGTGIPLAFVPCPSIVHALVAADTGRDRLDILMDSKDRILKDCRDALDPDDGSPVAESLAMLPPLLLEAIDVLEAGHVAACCTLATSVIDSALRRTSKKTFNYNVVRTGSVKIKLQEAVAKNEFRVALAERPLHSLLEEWRPDIPKPMPSMPSRHVVAHWADPSHMTEVNAIITTMAATSLILGLAEREAVSALIDGEMR
ncbi:hypothetical protein GCM10009632_51340 [Mycolicibacterium alvei]|uniref:Uncharacterized protein n=1 Tax=Mycolicibacterium alvei TaxID=67081 RepID=A0A6N4UNH3_9MYCO|nr:hypothetical protein MALV_05380 [Mycolicibacterium alvei]